MKGSYVLLIELPEERVITVGSPAKVPPAIVVRRAGVRRAGRLPSRHFPRGYYAYVGSAMGGFKARISRHFKSNKKLHWHIDYLLEKASITGIILCQTNERVECTIAQALSYQFDSVPGFGCSDCKCRSHLFFAAEERQMNQTIMATLNSLSLALSINAQSV